VTGGSSAAGARRGPGEGGSTHHGPRFVAAIRQYSVDLTPFVDATQVAAERPSGAAA
jgi:hypothetical protein